MQECTNNVAVLPLGSKTASVSLFAFFALGLFCWLVSVVNGVVSLSLSEGLPVCSFGPVSLQPLFVHSSEEAANAGAAVATIIMAAIRAAAINKLMRLITLYPFLITSTQLTN